VQIECCDDSPFFFPRFDRTDDDCCVAKPRVIVFFGTFSPEVIHIAISIFERRG
jgi:hypothetical protein